MRKKDKKEKKEKEGRTKVMPAWLSSKLGVVNIHQGEDIEFGALSAQFMHAVSKNALVTKLTGAIALEIFAQVGLVEFSLALF